MPERLRHYMSRRRLARGMLEEPQYGLHKPEETFPPEGEQTTFHAVWAIEAYTPLHAKGLFERLEELGFGRDQSWHEGGISKRLERARRGPGGASWLNLEHVFPPGESPTLLFDRIEAPLPSGVRVARPALHALTPSVTVLVVQFVLRDDAATAFDRLSRETNFKPRTRILHNGVSLMPPDQVKQGALRELRADLRCRATQWVVEHVPGAFASRLADAVR